MLLTLSLVALAVLLAVRAARSVEASTEVVSSLDVARWNERGAQLRAASAELRDAVDQRRHR